MKGRFVVCNFFLNGDQWDNFSKFYESNRRGILTKNDLNKGSNQIKNPSSQLDGHSVLLIEIAPSYIRFLNSWVPAWADEGTFKVKEGDILTESKTNKSTTYYDIFFYENDLDEEEKQTYIKNIDYIHEILNNFEEKNVKQIKNRINTLYNFRFNCRGCKINQGLDKFKTFLSRRLYQAHCLSCGFTGDAEKEI